MIKTIIRMLRSGDRDLIPLVVGAQTARVRDFFLRFVYAQHNARVIIDFESRMSAVIYAATGGLMSKSYYHEDAMLAEIREHESRERDFWYAEGRKDVCEELGMADPDAESPS